MEINKNLLYQVVLFLEWECDEKWEDRVCEFLDDYVFIETILDGFDLEGAYASYFVILQHIENKKYYMFPYTEYLDRDLEIDNNILLEVEPYEELKIKYRAIC